MVGLSIVAHPLAAQADETSVPRGNATSTWLDVSISGIDDSTRVFTAGVPGGGTMLTFFQMPADNGGTPKDRELTLTVDGEAVAAASASLKDGAMVPSASSDLEQQRDDGGTTVTVEATSTSQTIFLLPEQAPRAADPDDQSWVTKLWSQLMDGLGFGDSDESSNSDGSGQDNSEKEASESESAGSDKADQADESEAASATPTSSPTASSSSDQDTSDSEGEEKPSDEASNEQPRESSSNSTEASSSPTTADDTDTDSNSDAESHAGDEAGSDDTESEKATDQGEAESGVCVELQGKQQLTTSTEDEGGQDEDYAVSDGPSSAPSFSAEARAKAAAKATTNCDDDSNDGENSQDGEFDADSDSADSSGSSSGSSSSSAEGITRADIAAGDWLSGAAGNPAGIGDLRGAEAEVATTWANGGSNGIDVPQLQDGGEYSQANWNKSLIVSVSPFEDGGSWAKAAAGDYDSNWKKQLTNIKNGWGDRNGELFVSLAWELNGYWFAWNVTADETDDFRTAWSRYRELQKKILPEALLTLTMNRESNGYDGDSSDLIVTGDVDVYGVDYYNHYPYAATMAEFEADLNERDGGGGPKGLEAHREVAEAAGVPVVLPEWNGSAKNGDAPDFFIGMHDFFAKNAGPGAGQVLAESLFEIIKDDNNWALLGGTKMPKSAAAYAEEFNDVG